MSSGASFGATGVFGSYIGINPNASGNTWYGAQQWGSITITSFDGSNLGTFTTTDTLQISAFQVHTFKSGSGNVTGAELQYRVYPTGSPTGSFTSVAAGFISDQPFNSAAQNNADSGGDQNWGVNPTANLGDLLSGITQNGVYDVEVFFRAFTNDGDRFSNNGGDNFIASFTVIPEPTTALLAAFGALALLRRRRA